MAQKKAFEVDGWLAKPDPRIAVVLFYGPDRGLVSERAKRFAEKSGLPLDDPFTVVRIDASAGEGDDGRLLEEARMVSMFAARRLLWVRNAGAQKALVENMAELAGKPPADAIVLVEAGELKKGAPLRKAVEDSPNAMALPCYADEERSVETLIEDAVRRHRLTIAPDARGALRSLLGGDRLASRGELEKLALYAGDGGAIALADIRVLTGDVSAPATDEMVDHVLAGDGAAFGALFARQVRTAGHVQQLLSMTLRQFQLLHLLRGRMDVSRQSAAAVIGGLKPPVFSSRRAALEKALSRWTASGIQQALSHLQETVLDARRHGNLDLAIAERALMRIAAGGSARKP